MSRHPADPRKQPKQARSRATVDRILEGAARVLAEEGYAATTDRIAAAAHVSVGSLYQYFPHKDAMILALATRHLELSRETLSRPLAVGRQDVVDAKRNQRRRWLQVRRSMRPVVVVVQVPDGEPLCAFLL